MDEYGYKLPRGTLVYYWDAYQYPVSHILTDSYTWPDFSPDRYRYIFTEDERLWASDLVRSFWKRKPQSHPHATLFSILRDHLTTKNYI